MSHYQAHLGGGNQQCFPGNISLESSVARQGVITKERTATGGGHGITSVAHREQGSQPLVLGPHPANQDPLEDQHHLYDSSSSCRIFLQVFKHSVPYQHLPKSMNKTPGMALCVSDETLCKMMKKTRGYWEIGIDIYTLLCIK